MEVNALQCLLFESIIKVCFYDITLRISQRKSNVELLTFPKSKAKITLNIISNRWILKKETSEILLNFMEKAA